MMFPNPSHLGLLDLIGYFSEAAERRANPLPQLLAQQVQKEINQAIPPEKLIETVADLQKVWNQAVRKRQTPDWDLLAEHTARCLNLGSPQEAKRVLPLLLPYTGTVEEHLAVPIVTITFLEAMLDSLLDRIAAATASDGESYDLAAEKIEKFGSFKERKDYFKELTGTPLKTAMTATEHRRFYDDWKQVRDDRNEFVHGSPYALTAGTARLSLELARRAVPLFAELQNSYGLQTVAAEQPSE